MLGEDDLALTGRAARRGGGAEGIVAVDGAVAVVVLGVVAGLEVARVHIEIGVVAVDTGVAAEVAEVLVAVAVDAQLGARLFEGSVSGGVVASAWVMHASRARSGVRASQIRRSRRASPARPRHRHWKTGPGASPQARTGSSATSAKITLHAARWTGSSTRSHRAASMA